MKKIAIINGANLNFTGIRERDIYGDKTLKDIEKDIALEGAKQGLNVAFFSSNIEGEIINYLQKCYFEKIDGIIINAGAFTHYSYAIKDAICSVNIPTIEVHISNIYKREKFRQKSVIASVCLGCICGFGEYSYILGLYAIKNHLENNIKI